jgi:hypothetical protein
MNTDEVLKEVLQSIQVDEDDLKRWAIDPDERLAQAMAYVRQRQPWRKPTDILRELLFKAVLDYVDGNGKSQRLERIETVVNQHSDRFDELGERLARLEGILLAKGGSHV